MPSGINAGIADSGIEMSCDDTAPIMRFASGMRSRTAQKSCACCSDWAIRPSETSSCSSASPNRISKASCGSSPPDTPISIRTVHSGMSANGRRTSGRVSARKSMPVRCINSNALMVSPKVDRASDRSDRAAVGSATTNIAVPVFAGRGDRRRLAAVMMPRLPSAPISRLRRSYPVLSLRRRFSPCQISPLGRTASSPRHSSRALP